MRYMVVMLSMATFLLGACSQVIKNDQTTLYNSNKNFEHAHQILVINECAPKGNLINKFGDESDWRELYNLTDSVVTIQKNEWFLTDDETKPTKFALPEMTIVPHGFVLIWCDGNITDKKNIHANFKISSDRESISLYYKSEVHDRITCDQELKKKFSFGREKDGEQFWKILKNPSPGISNQLPDHYAESAH